MIASDAELAQMERDGKGRISVIKELARIVRSGQVKAPHDSVLIRGRWVHYLTECQSGHEKLRIRHIDGSETEVPLK